MKADCQDEVKRTKMSSQVDYEENLDKFKGICINSLRKIQKTVHPGHEAKEDALLYIESLILKLLRILISSSPRSILDVEERVKKSFPSPVDKWALDKAHSVIGDPLLWSKKNVKKVMASSNLISFPYQDFHQLLVKEVLCYKIELHVTAFIIALLEWVAADIFKLSGNYVINCRQKTISYSDIRVAMCADNVLMDLFYGDSESDENDGYLGQVLQSIINSKDGVEPTDSCKAPPTYDECVKNVIQEEQQFIRDLNLIIKVFREPFVKLLMTIEESNSSATNSLPSSPTSLTTPTNSGQWSVPSSPTHKSPAMISQKDIDIIFSNVLEVAEFSVNFLCSLEDALEATAPNDDQVTTGTVSGVPKSGIESIGSCFEEMAESAEFDVFERFAQEVMGSNTPSGQSPSQERLTSLLQDVQLTNSLNTRGGGFLLAVRYVLPMLLNGVVYHCFTYLDYIKILRQLSPSEEDRESFSQAESVLQRLRQQLDQITQRKPAKFGENYLSLYSVEKRRNLCPLKPEFFKGIDGLDQNQTKFNNQFVLEGMLGKISGSKRDQRASERHAFLFEGRFLLYKPSNKRTSGLVSNSHHHHHHHHHHMLNTDFKLKEEFYIRKIDLIDHPDGPESMSHSASCGHGHNAGDDTMSVSESLASIRPGWSSLMSSASPWVSTTSLASTIISNSVSGISSSSNFVNLPRNSFEISSRDVATSVTLFAKSYEEKLVWMSNLILLSTKFMLERQLESIISDEEKKNPLQVPPTSTYRFAEADSETNIVFEENKFNKSGVRLIRGATLVKLIERLTCHQHGDTDNMHIFLTTYRSFCSPEELVTLLIERFDIPDIESNSREDVKRRFKLKYCQPIQFRVLNVIRHWMNHHYYDFEREPLLLDRLEEFLRSGRIGNNMKKWVDSILKIISRKKDFSSNGTSSTRAEVFLFNGIPPPFERFLARCPEDFGLLTIHPVEFGRQLTLLEFELFRRVTPSELVGCAWTTKNKEKTSPNLLRMIHFSTTFTYWLEKEIIECENFEERVALISRVVEIMLVLKSLNNFNGMLEIVSAINSAAVFRLEHTMSTIPVKLKKALDEACELNSEHNRKYQEQLRSINPPCVPFLGMYLTNIVHIEEGNPNEIEGGLLINFSKRRKVAEITGEIQQYQNTPYCLNTQSEIRSFLESLDPLLDMPEIEFSTYLYNKSLEIEPRGASAPAKFPRRWPDMPLKSPGIKPPNPVTFTTTLSRAKTPFSNFVSSSVDAQASFSAQISPTAHNTMAHDSAPTSPMTPPSTSDHSVFAQVIIGGAGQFQVSTTPVHSTPPTPSPLSASSGPPPPSATPPPLPPRTQRPRIVSSTSDREESPPPLPPRGVASMAGPNSRGYISFQRQASSSSNHSATLAGHHHHHQNSTSSLISTPPPITNSTNNPNSNSTLSRRNSALDLPLAPPPTPRRHSQSASINLPPGHPPPPPPSLPSPMPNSNRLEATSEEAIPQLPPRTYRSSQHLLLR